MPRRAPRHRKPARITTTAAGATVAAAAATISAVAVMSAPASAGQPAALTSRTAGAQDQAPGRPSAHGQPDGLGLQFPAIPAAGSGAAAAREAAHLRAVLAADRRRAARAVAARAAARAAAARAARQRASRARHRAASQSSPAGSAAPSGSPQQIAQAMLGSYGWPASQFSCLDQLWTRESGWNYQAENASGAYGIPQALPGSKMASAGADWATDPTTQIRWGLGYIKSLYGTPCGAWAHELSTGWY